jgi:glutathione S-transferase
MSVTIYGIPGSPYVRAALVGCEEKGVAYDFRHMNFGESKSPEHLARHAFGRIPAFEHDGFALYETQAICATSTRSSPARPCSRRSRARRRG